MKKIKLLKTLLIPTIGIIAIGTIASVSTSCSSVVPVTSYICITANADSNLELRNSDNNPNLQYSPDGKNWTTYSEKINIPANGKIYLKGINQNGWSLSNKKYSFFKIAGDVSLSGSIMSLLDNGTGTISSIPNEYCFYDLFDGSEGITSVSENFLPATGLTENCYANMFINCTSLTTAPALPATTLANFCYYNMFSNCTSITTTPELPATTIASNCYSNMFDGCTSLTTAPALPAITLATGCYWYMFNGCTLLTTAPALPATTLSSYCYYAMFQYCTSLITAPDLPATNLADHCYYDMFQGCTLLNSVRISYGGTASRAPSGAFDYWVNGVAPSGTFYYKGSDTLENFGLPSGWTINPN